MWLTQAQLAELYKVNVPAVSKQIQNVFEDKELQEYSVISILEITAADGKCYQTKHYNLEMLIALGYRIKSKVATKFRQWATKHLKEMMTKGRTEIETQPQLCSVSDMKQWSIPHAQGDSDSTSESPQVVIQKWVWNDKNNLHNIRRFFMQAEMLDSAVSNPLQLFADKGFKVRVIMRCSDPWFVAKDVATCIEHSDTSVMCKLCRDKDKVVVRANDLTSDDLSDVKNREYTLISESGLYRILAKCNLPKCEPFESWVFDEVLPSIRKTGGLWNQLV